MARRIDKEKLAATIRELQGVDNELKSQLLQLLNEKKYGLVWENHIENAEEELRTKVPVFTEVKERFVDSTDTDAPNHILIEGDNLHALNALTYTHEGKVDVIYIDPPYNTGNKDFVYNDSYVDAEDGYRHSKWLSFMEKRLRIAKRLLSDRGVIFISIDDNEQANLKLLCDDVFGSDQFIGNVIWEKVDSPRMDVTGFSVRHDYILVYGKSEFKLNRLPVEEIPKHYNRTDEKGRRYYTKPMRIMGGHISESLFYPLIAPDGTEVFPYDKNGEKSGWRWSKKKVEDESDRIDWVNGKNGWNPYFRIYAENMKEMPVETIWKFEQVGSNRTAKNSLNEILGDNAFSYPKPTTLIEHILKISGNKDSIVLDFFAGSGTTLNAVIHFNSTDDGHRQCILVTNNENNICEEVTYERNKRVIKGYLTPKEKFVEGLKSNKLRYFKTELKERELTHQSKRELFMAMTDLLCIKENCYTEQPSFGSLPLNGKQKMLRYFAEKDAKMLMIYDTRVIPFIIKEIKKMDGVNIKVYIFADGAYPYTEDFADVLGKVTLIPMPHAMVQALKNTLPVAAEDLLAPTDLTAEEQDELMKEAIEAENNEQ